MHRPHVAAAVIWLLMAVHGVAAAHCWFLHLAGPHLVLPELLLDLLDYLVTLDAWKVLSGLENVSVQLQHR